MHRVGIGGGVNRDRLDAHFLAGADDAQGNLAPIGDEDFGKHVCHLFEDDEGFAKLNWRAVINQNAQHTS